ncbi:alpha-amylase family glycosyl hydrolase [Microbacteriaceae bacterium 4G12]
MYKRVLILLFIPFFLLNGMVLRANAQEERDWQDETIYFLLVDRFNDGDTKNDSGINTQDLNAYHGGDLQGVIKRLDYIQKMGFTSIWLTPVVEQKEGSYDGYSPQDFSKMDKHFGSLKDMQQLVEEAHKRKLKVIVDYPVSYMKVATLKKDWYVEGGNLLLNYNHPEVKKYFIDNAKWWVQQTNIDGFGIPEMYAVPQAFWNDFVHEVKAVKKDFFLIGTGEQKGASYEQTGMDSFVNVNYQKNMTDVFVKPNQSIAPLYKDWQQNQEGYKNPYALGSSIDNQNTKRFARVVKEENQYPPARLKLALAYMYTSPGIPIMYYGTEIALDGGDVPDNRRLMDFKTDEKFLNYITKLGELRHALPALRRGAFEELYDKEGMTVFKRTYKGEVIVIAINNTTKTQKIHLTNEQLSANKELRGLLEQDFIRPTKDGYDIVLEREKANVYALANKTGLNLPLIFALVGICVSFIIFLILAKRKGNNMKKTS